MLGFCSRQSLAPGNPTKQSYSQAIHLVFSKDKQDKMPFLNLFFYLPVSWFLLFGVWLVLPRACLLLASCSLPFLCWLLLHAQGGKIRAEGIWGARSHCSRCWGWPPWITTATGAGRHGKSLALSHIHGSPGCCSGAVTSHHFLQSVCWSFPWLHQELGFW